MMLINFKVLKSFIHEKMGVYYQKIRSFQDFPGGPVVETPRFQRRGCGFGPWSGKARVPSLVGELRSHMPCRAARKKKKKRRRK